MLSLSVKLAVTVLFADLATSWPTNYTKPHDGHHQHHMEDSYYVSTGPRPYYILNNMTDSPLKTKLQTCENGPFEITGFSIGHRGGGTLQFPEETVESTMAGARMGAGILECDVAFTSDRGLVCRHSLCDLHTTTNILLHPELAAKCTVPFTPANGTANANALCCTSDITKTEFLSLCGKQDGFNASATNVEDYQYGTPTWRTELYDTCGTVQSLDSYITLVDQLPGHRNFTPELKTPPAQVPMPFKGYTQEQYARDLMETFISRGIAPNRVWAQSFNPPDIYQWIKEYPLFGAQAVFLTEDGDTPALLANATSQLASIRAAGVNILSPPFGYLLTTTSDNRTIIPSAYALEAKRLGFDIIAWTFERSGPLAKVASTQEYYYTQIAQGISYDGQEFEVLDVLTREVGIKAIFSDWSGTVTYFANCMGLKYFSG
jgi:glycerophosphoryl diester phosphodiesterase